MKKYFGMYGRALALMLAISGLTACSEEEPEVLAADVEVSIRTNEHWGSLVFDIQSISDSTTISNVVVNRGSCSIPNGTQSELNRTVTLKFGETYTGYSNNCTVNKVKEIEVTSSAGTFVYSF